jgi:hypothetical protein
VPTMSSSWHYYSRDLDTYEKRLDEIDYVGVAPKPEATTYTQGFYTFFGPTDGLSLTADLIASLLSTIKPEHGYGILAPLPIPELPYFPTRPNGPIPTQKSGISFFGRPPNPPGFNPAIIAKEERLKEKTVLKQKELEQKFHRIKAQLQAVQERCATNDYNAIRCL